MNLEIERKFLCNLTEEEAKKLAFYYKEIHSTYLANTETSSFRIVKEINPYGIVSCKTTHKESVINSIARKETENNISQIVYDSIDHKSFPTISKKRYLIKHNGNIWEVDFFKTYSFVIAELEFISEERALEFKDFPSWLTKEVTKDPYYLNCNLASFQRY